MRTRKPQRSGRRIPTMPEVEDGVRTFRRWHEFDPERVEPIHGPERVIPETLVYLGELIEVVYRSDKWNPGEKKLYSHKTQKPHPILATDPEGRHVYIVGGRMKVTSRGLVG